MNDQVSILLLLLIMASASAKLRPFGVAEDAEAVTDDYSLPPRITKQPLVPTQYFLHKGRFGKKLSLDKLK